MPRELHEVECDECRVTFITRSYQRNICCPECAEERSRERQREREHGYDPEQVGARGKIFADTLMKNVELSARLNVCESALISMVQHFFYSAEGSNVYSHAFMSAEEEAAAYLVGVGLAYWNDVHHSQIVFPEVKE